MIVLDKYEEMLEAIGAYVDAEIAAHTRVYDLDDIEDDALYIMTGKQLREQILGEMGDE